MYVNAYLYPVGGSFIYLSQYVVFYILHICLGGSRIVQSLNNFMFPQLYKALRTRNHRFLPLSHPCTSLCKLSPYTSWFLWSVPLNFAFQRELQQGLMSKRILVYSLVERDGENQETVIYAFFAQLGWGRLLEYKGVFRASKTLNDYVGTVVVDQTQFHCHDPVVTISMHRKTNKLGPAYRNISTLHGSRFQ